MHEDITTCKVVVAYRYQAGQIRTNFHSRELHTNRPDLNTVDYQVCLSEQEEN